MSLLFILAEGTPGEAGEGEQDKEAVPQASESKEPEEEDNGPIPEVIRNIK